MTTLSTNYSNDLPEIVMIAGDKQDFSYSFFTSACALIDVTTGSCTVVIFRYGDPSHAILTLTGSPVGDPINVFTAVLPSACSLDLSGAYQQQPKVTYDSGDIYSPSQGKIYVYPTPSS